MCRRLQGLTNSNCSGLCLEGYYCEEAATRRDELPCGAANVYCPTGSFEPTVVSIGYYTTGACSCRLVVSVRRCACPLTRSCVREAGNVDEQTRYNHTICPLGMYCLDGVRIECPPGRYGATLGLADSSCSGECAAGHYCPSASTSPRQVPCRVLVRRFPRACAAFPSCHRCRNVAVHCFTTSSHALP